MWKPINLLAILLLSVIMISACSENKSIPTRPQDQGVALTLKYQSYASIEGRDYYCIRLTMDNNDLDQCDLGENSQSIGNGTYTWILYAVGNTQKAEGCYQIATGTVTLDRNKTCIINGNTVNWQ